MIATANSHSPAQAANRPYEQFLHMLPIIQRRARYAFRHVDPEARGDMVAEVVAYAFSAYHQLVERGKTELAYATPLSNFGIRQARSGRRVGGQLNVNDVAGRQCQINKGVRVARLDRQSEEDGQWQEILVEDRRAGPAAVASMRIDFNQWLRILPDRMRKIALLLATGESTQEAARQFHMSPARISQLRGELKASWREFQGEAATAIA